MPGGKELHFTYHVVLNDKGGPEELAEDIYYSYGGVGEFAENSGTGWLSWKDSVQYSPVEGMSFEVTVYVGSKFFSGEWGGMPRVASLVFGNPFRNGNILSAKLLRVDFSGELETQFGGPGLGLEGMKKLLHGVSPPFLSVPLPFDLGEDGLSGLVNVLCKSGVSIMCQGPISLLTPTELLDRMQVVRGIATKCKKRCVYFINATAELDLIRKYVDILQAESDHEWVTFGLRYCPVSTGFGLASGLRKTGFPLFAYNLFHKTITNGKSFVIGGGAMTTLLRVGGADLVSVGLRAQDAVADGTAMEIVASATRNTESGIGRSCPVFTGGLTPRRTSQVIHKFGSELVLHTGRPILRGGFSEDNVSRNLRAIREAIQVGLSGGDVEAELAKENHGSKCWREYEKKYGRD